MFARKENARKAGSQCAEMMEKLTTVFATWKLSLVRNGNQSAWRTKESVVCLSEDCFVCLQLGLWNLWTICSELKLLLFLAGSICLSDRMFIGPCFYLNVCVFISLFVFLHIKMSVCASFQLVCLSFYLFFVYLLTCIFIWFVLFVDLTLGTL